MMLMFPAEILAIIFNNLEGLADQVRFSLVSKSWRCVALEENHRQPAWLLIPSDGLENTNKEKHVNFFDMFSGKVLRFELPKPLLHGGRMKIHGCSKGWLIISTASELKHHLFLFNPLTSFHIKLPSIATLPVYSKKFLKNWIDKDSFDLSLFINRVELSSATLSDCTIAMLCDDYEIALCTPYSNQWLAYTNQDLFLLDILFSGSILYVLTLSDDVKTRPEDQMLKTYIGTDLESIILKTIPIVSLLSPLGRNIQYIGYEADDYTFFKDRWTLSNMILTKDKELLIVCQVKNYFRAKDEDSDSFPILTYPQTSQLRVFKLKPPEESSLGWSATEVDDLEDQILFVAPNGSTSVQLCSELKARGWTSNYIYFADAADHDGLSNQPLVSRELGVFRLNDNTIKRPFPSFRYPLECPSAWLTPQQA